MAGTILSNGSLVKTMSSPLPDKMRKELRRRRLLVGYTQGEMAVQVGISRQAYHAIEFNGAMPKAQTRAAIARVLDANPEDFLEELAA